MKAKLLPHADLTDADLRRDFFLTLFLSLTISPMYIFSCTQFAIYWIFWLSARAKKGCCGRKMYFFRIFVLFVMKNGARKNNTKKQKARNKKAKKERSGRWNKRLKRKRGKGRKGKNLSLRGKATGTRTFLCCVNQREANGGRDFPQPDDNDIALIG